MNDYALILGRKIELPLLHAFASLDPCFFTTRLLDRCCAAHAFFWDTVQLASKHAHFFYENGLRWVPLPPAIDSGHPPLLGYYLALVWTIAGKTLTVSHWAMYPFLVALMVQLFKISRYFSTEWGVFLLPILLLDAVIAGQSVLIGPDIILLLAFLMVVRGVLFPHTTPIVIGGLLLSVISMRGMMCLAALFMWTLLLTPGTVVQKIKAGIGLWPGALVGLLFLIWHDQATGWVGHFEGSTWSDAFVRVDAKGFLRNVAVLGWRWLDLNRFVLWIFVLYLVYQSGSVRSFYRKSRPYVLLLLCLILFLTPSALLYQNLSAHRYFLPIFAALHLLVFSAIMNWETTRRTRQTILVLGVVCMATGNFWVYPRGVSMDWDCTLSHLSYHPLRARALRYIDKQAIDYQSIGTTFPCLNTGENLLLNGDHRLMAPLDLEHNQWVLASNVLNDIDEPEYAILAQDWTLRQRWQEGFVWFELWQKRL